jgi:RsiW-degrading membrane proteinase PrsW (M82 family)
VKEPPKPWLLVLLLIVVIIAIIWLRYYALSNGAH